MAVAKNIDDKIVSLLETLRVKKAEVEHAEAKTKRGWVTNCTFELGWSQIPINIQTASVSRIIECLAYLNVFSDSAKRLGVEEKVGGFPFESWKTDFEKRIAVIEIRQKKSDLAALESRLSALISPEIRRAMELELIEKELLK